MKRNEPISKIMSTNLVTVHHGDPFSKVRKLAQEHGVHHIPVVNGHELVGMISWTDIMRTVDAALDHTMKLEDIMRKDPVSMQSSSTIREAAEILTKGDFHSLPICEGKNLVGLVTTTDLIRYLHDQF
jgi:CBS domain-containing protein